MSYSTLSVAAVASGKGGVGKTVLTACLGTLAAEDRVVERKVLLADLDFGVKGLTFLYASADNWIESEVCSMIDVIEGKQTPSKVLGKARKIDKMHLIPSDIDFQRKVDWDTYLPKQEVIKEAISNFLSEAKSNGFNFVVFDTGAGINAVTLALGDLVDKLIVVIEPDEISLTSAMNLRGELGEVLTPLHFVVNKSTDIDVVAKYSVAEELKELNVEYAIPFDQRFYSKFIKNARVFATDGFQGTRYRRYVGQFANSCFGVWCSQPTFVDYILSKTIARHLARLFGYGLLFSALLIAVIVASVLLLE